MRWTKRIVVSCDDEDRNDNEEGSLSNDSESNSDNNDDDDDGKDHAESCSQSISNEQCNQMMFPQPPFHYPLPYQLPPLDAHGMPSRRTWDNLTIYDNKARKNAAKLCQKVEAIKSKAQNEGLKE